MTHPNNNKLTKIAITSGITYGAATDITLRDAYNGVFTFNFPTGQDLDKTTRKLYIINQGSHVVLEYSITAANFLTRIVAGILNEAGSDNQHLADPFYLRVKHADNNVSRPVLYVSDRSNHRIQKYESLDNNVAVTAGEVQYPYGLDVLSNGTFFLAKDVFQTAIRFQADVETIQANANFYYDVKQIGNKIAITLKNNIFAITLTCSVTFQNCATCAADYLTCTSCVSPLYLSYSQYFCGAGCPNGQYKETVSRTCLLCNELCKTCDGPNSNNCVSCFETEQQRTLSGSSCGCKQYHYLQVGNLVCQQCDDICETCFGPEDSNCLTCKTGLNRILISSKCECLDHYYSLSDSTNICAECHAQCTSCNGPTDSNCLSCFSSSNRELMNNRCVCKPGYYETSATNPQCILCSQTIAYCPYCTDSQTCSGCLSNLVWDTITKSCSCETVLESNYPLCKTCSELNSEIKCLECDENGACLTVETEENSVCTSNQFIFESELKCTYVCQSINYKYYGNEETNLCEPCYSGCKFCIGPNRFHCIALEFQLILTEIVNPYKFQLEIKFTNKEWVNLPQETQWQLWDSVIEIIFANFNDFINLQFTVSGFQQGTDFTIQGQRQNAQDYFGSSSIRLTNTQIVAAYAPFQFLYEYNAMPLQPTITCELEYQCYDIVSKTCISDEFQVIPSVMPTKDNDKFILIFEKFKNEGSQELINLNKLYTKLLVSIDKLQNYQYQYTLQNYQGIKISNGWVYLLIFNFTQSLLDKVKIKLAFENPKKNSSQECSITFFPEVLYINLTNYIKFADESIEKNKDIANVIKIQSQIINYAALFISFSGTSFGYSCAMANQFQFLLLFIDQTYPPNLKQFFIHNNYYFMPADTYLGLDITPSAKDILSLDGKFAEWQVSPIFLNNYLETGLIELGLLVIGFAIQWSLTKLAAFYGENSTNIFARLCNGLNQLLVWNFILAYYFLNYIKLSLYLWANIGLSTFDSSILGNINFHLAIVLKVIQIGSYFWMHKVINDHAIIALDKQQEYKSIHTSDNPWQETEFINKSLSTNVLNKFKILFSSYKHELVQQRLFSIFEIASYEIMCCFVATCHNNAVAQIIPMTLMPVTSIYLVIKYKPFISDFRNYTYLANQIIILSEVVLVMTFIPIPSEDVSKLVQIANQIGTAAEIQGLVVGVFLAVKVLTLIKSSLWKSSNTSEYQQLNMNDSKTRTIINKKSKVVLSKINQFENSIDQSSVQIESDLKRMERRFIQQRFH